MFRLTNIHISTKLTAMSAISILLVIGMLAVQWWNSSSAEKASAAAARESKVALLIADATDAVRGLEVSVRDIIMSTDQGQLEKARKQVARHQKQVDSALAEALSLTRARANATRLNTAKQLTAQYVGTIRKVSGIQEKIIKLRTDGTQEGNGARQFAILTDEVSRTNQGQVVPLCNKLEAELDQAVAFTKQASQRLSRQEGAAMATAFDVIMGIGLVAVVVLVGAAFFGAMTITKPLSALRAPLRDIAGGDFATAVPGVERKDEIGEIAVAVQMVVDKVGATVGNIKSAANEVTGASAEISASTTDLSQRTEEQAASLEETSASMEEISSTVKKNAENARQANEFASETNTVAERGGAVVSEAVSAMARIEESSRKISDIIGVIDEIARQTNLLALNAAVEAARAGEAGRGFAVVASEVRTLAQRSSQAAKDIKELIVNSSNEVKDGVDLVNKAGASLSEIVASIKKVTDIVADIANASMEQATGLEQINRALNQMDEVTQQNSALVEENAATAKTLEEQARAMDAQVAYFKIGNGADLLSAAAGAVLAPASAAKPVATPVVRPAAKAKAAAAPQQQPVDALKPAAAAGDGGGPARRMQAAVAAAVNADADWQEF